MTVDKRSYTTVDKSAWPRGEWDGEPDKIQWVDEATGLDCLVVRHDRLGHLCGYVGVPPEHPLHGRDYSDVYGHLPGGEDGWPDTGHSELTYSDRCQPSEDESKGICHVPGPGRPHDVWWFGFDCAHLGDLSPGTERFTNHDFGESYKAMPYVRRCTERLARTLAGVSSVSCVTEEDQ